MQVGFFNSATPHVNKRLLIDASIFTGSLWAWLIGFFPIALAQVKDRYLHLSAANDVLFQTDRYYTSGLQLSYVAPVFTKLPLHRLTPLSKDSPIAWQGIMAEQHIFTPNDLKSGVVPPQDRPYAAHLSIGVFRVAANAGRQLREAVALKVGIMGAPSLGEVIQRTMHQIAPAAQAQGWGNQLGDMFFVQGDYLYEKGLRVRKSSELRWQAIGAAGMLQIAAGTGLYYRFGQLIPFTEHWILSSKTYTGEGLQGFAFINPQIWLRAYDATLQGGYFGAQNRFAQPWRQMNMAMGMFKSGFQIAHGKFGLGMTHTLATPEFRHAFFHNWVTASLSVRF